MNTSDAPDDDQRPLKRTRQACDPCRRKKSKCSGERPVCATCDRLRTRCSYSTYHMGPPTEPSSQAWSFRPQSPDSAPDAWPRQNRGEPQGHWQDRIESLESTLAEVVQGLRDRNRRDSDLASLQPDRDSAWRRSSAIASTSSSACNAPPVDHPTDVPWELATDIAKAYLDYCDCQPLPLFLRDGFVSSFPNRDLGIVYGVIALATRFADKPVGSAPDDTLIDSRRYAEAARRRATSQLASSCVELHTLQTLCLLALVNFHNGDMTLMRIHTSLAITLARCAHLDHEATSQSDGRIVEERRRCYWSIVLLQRLFGDGTGIPQPSHIRSSIPRFPISAATPSTVAGADQVQHHAAASSPVNEQSGIIYVVVKLSEAWSQAQQYIHNRGSSEHAVPPWSPDSEYSKVLQSVMSLSQHLPSIHKYRSIRLSGVSTRQLDAARDYWGPWLLSRLLYHSTICILNHPILIMLQLRGWHSVPELFLQQTTFQLNHHTSWVLHFIDFLESRQFCISDPLFAYCIVVLATIEWHQSFVEDDNASHKQQQRRKNYTKCFNLILTLSSTWPFLESVAKRLQHLKQEMVTSYESNLANTGGNICIDVSSFFDILDINRVFSTNSNAGSEGSLFGPTLSLRSPPDPPQSADLPRLPRITEMENPAGTPARNGDSAAGLQGSFPPAAGFPNLAVAGEMLFPADQLFGTFFDPSVDPWDAMMGPIVTDAVNLGSSGPPPA
ncbi:hypothetical protein FDECE_12553 [Fusarium decemcellulare]|nr:hypothetical protein FDECE_12553 [Fusarium decemcellulare]